MKYFAIKYQKLRGWLQKQCRPDEDKIDVLTMLLAVLTGLLLMLGLRLFFYEIVYLHKYRYYPLHTWQMFLARPDILLLLSPALNFPVLALRCGCHDERIYTRWTLAAALVLVVSAMIIALGNIFFWPFYESLP